MNKTDITRFGKLEDTGDFYGRYVVDIKLALLSCILADQHLMLIGDPSVGKTSITRGVFQKAFGDDFKFQSFTPATQPEAIEGMLDIKEAFENSTYVPNIVGTVSDPRWHGVILDEMSRANDPVMELMMSRLSRDNCAPGYHAMAVAPVNWIQKDARAEAFVDRFGQMHLVPSHSMVYAEVSKAMLRAEAQGRRGNKDVGGGIPDWDAICEVRNAIPDDATMNVVAKFVKDFAKLAERGLTDSTGKLVRSFTPNYRRIQAWTSIAYRVSVYFFQSETFAAVHEMAKKSLAFAWVTQDQAELIDWQMFVGMGSVDPIDGIVYAIMEQASYSLQSLYDSSTSGDKAKLTMDFGVAINKWSDEMISAMSEAGVGDPKLDERYQKSFQRLQRAFVNVMDGGSPFEVETENG